MRPGRCGVLRRRRRARRPPSRRSRRTSRTRQSRRRRRRRRRHLQPPRVHRRRRQRCALARFSPPPSPPQRSADSNCSSAQAAEGPQEAGTANGGDTDVREPESQEASTAPVSPEQAIKERLKGTRALPATPARLPHLLSALSAARGRGRGGKLRGRGSKIAVSSSTCVLVHVCDASSLRCALMVAQAAEAQREGSDRMGREAYKGGGGGALCQPRRREAPRRTASPLPSAFFFFFFLLLSCCLCSVTAVSPLSLCSLRAGRDGQLQTPRRVLQARGRAEQRGGRGPPGGRKCAFVTVLVARVREPVAVTDVRQAPRRRRAGSGASFRSSRT